MTPEEGERLQKAYRRKRKAWAKAVNRPYPEEPGDVRPPPGEIDVPIGMIGEVLEPDGV